MSEDTQISSSVTVRKYKRLVAENDRKALAKFLIDRFNERYFWVIEPPCKHGFTLAAVSCIVIETLESFYQGLPDTKGRSAQMFKDFFAKNTELKVLASEDGWFYRDIRCGILHQSEAPGGWRILRKGELLNSEAKTINATAILKALKNAVNQYAQQLEKDELLWKNFRTKMDAVCTNCG